MLHEFGYTSDRLDEGNAILNEAVTQYSNHIKEDGKAQGNPHLDEGLPEMGFYEQRFQMPPLPCKCKGKKIVGHHGSFVGLIKKEDHNWLPVYGILVKKIFPWGLLTNPGNFAIRKP